MSDFLSDQDILNLIGDMSNFMGMPGGTMQGEFEGAPTSTSAQHPLYPLTATFFTNGMSGVVSVGFPGDRCILPTADGHSNIVTDIHTELGLPFKFNVPANFDPVQSRYDLVVGQAMLNGSASGEAALGATFKYHQGTAGQGPPAYELDFAPVVQIVLPPNATGLHSSNARVILPALSFMSLAGSGSFTNTAASGTAVPLTAAAVTASPFNTPVIAGGAQGLIAPTQDAMPSIQAALTAVGPGGAIYIPSGTYGVKTPATTLNGNLPSPLGQPSGGPGPLSGPLGQTIIFGGAVNFVALADTPALVLTDGCVTVGAPKFWDVSFAANATSGGAQPTIAGLGAYPVNNVANVQSSWATNGQFATVADSFGTVLAGMITAAVSGATGSITVDTRGTLLTPTTSGSVALGAVRSLYTIPISGATSTSFDVGQEIFITGSGGWMTAFLTQSPGPSSITVESLAQSATSGSISSGASIYRTYTIPSSTSGTLGGAGSTSPLNIAISNTLSSFAVQLSGKAQTIEALYVDGWANGVLLGPSPQFVPGYGTEGFVGGVVGSIRCDDIRGTGVQLCGKPSAHVEDTHIKHLRCGAGNAPNGGVCGVDIVNVQQNNANAISIARGGARGFNGALGPFTGTPTPNPAGMCATGIMLRNLDSGRNSGPLQIRLTEFLLSSVGTAVYMDQGSSLIDFGILLAPGGGFGSVYTSGSPGVPNTLNGYSFFANGVSGNPVNEISIGQANFLENPGSTLNSIYGIYLLNTTQFHCGYALVARKNQDGVRIGQGCASIGFDHLILQTNGQVSGYGINAVGTPAPSVISIDKLDLSAETAVGGAVNLGGASHVTYNDMGSFPAGGPTYLPAGYFNSDGVSGAAPVTHAFTAGSPGTQTPLAIAIANANSGSTVKQTSLGTSTRALNTIVGTIFNIEDIGITATIGQEMLTLDASGNTAIAGGLFLPGSVSLTSGSGAPVAGSMPNGSLYMRTDGTTGNRLYVSNGTTWTAVSGV